LLSPSAWLGQYDPNQSYWRAYNTIRRGSDLNRFDMFVSGAKTEKKNEMIKESEE